MLKVDLEKWGHGLRDLLDTAISSEHARTRERFFALYQVASGRSASSVALEFGRDERAVWGWVKKYNDGGPQMLQYQRTGGRRPFDNPPK